MVHLMEVKRVALGFLGGQDCLVTTARPAVRLHTGTTGALGMDSPAQFMKPDLGCGASL